MKIEVSNRNSETQNVPIRYTRRGKAVLGLLGAGLAVGTIAAGAEANSPDFHGEHTVTVTENNVTDIAMNHVKGADSDVRATVDKIIEMNPDVFQDGRAFVESEDLGEKIEVPKSVD